MKRNPIALLAWIAVSHCFAWIGCSECGDPTVGAGPPQTEVFQQSTDSASLLPELGLLDLRMTEAQWRQKAQDLWKPADVAIECAQLVSVPMITQKAIEPRMGDATTVQCVAGLGARVAGRPASARMVMVGGKIASASLVYSVSEKEQRISAFSAALGQPERVQLEDRADPVAPSLEAYIRLEHEQVSALLVGQWSVELIHQDLRVISMLGQPAGAISASIEGLGIGAFKATDSVELSTASQP